MAFAGYQSVSVALLRTASTSIAIPQGILKPQQRYVIRVRALSSPLSVLSRATSYPVIGADAVTGLLLP